MATTVLLCCPLQHLLFLFSPPLSLSLSALVLGSINSDQIHSHISQKLNNTISDL